jgi:hypothetical protein
MLTWKCIKNHYHITRRLFSFFQFYFSFFIIRAYFVKVCTLLKSLCCPSVAYFLAVIPSKELKFRWEESGNTPLVNSLIRPESRFANIRCDGTLSIRIFMLGMAQSKNPRISCLFIFCCYQRRACCWDPYNFHILQL